ncbi:MAG: hypothetical protein ACKO3K_06655 [Cuspidothrix sp.]
MTTSQEESDRRQGYGLGCNNYIPKAVDDSDFVELIKQLGM